MLFPTRSRLPKARKFEYKPRYFDPEEEERKERRKKLFEAHGSGSEGSKLRIAKGLKRHKDRRNRSESGAIRTNMILIVVLSVLIFFSWIFLNNYLEPFIESWFN
ncbi:MAG: hypothetical protein AAF502_03375 [Bacteroidota bacterium]